jgi:hypothetical protein
MLKFVSYLILGAFGLMVVFSMFRELIYNPAARAVLIGFVILAALAILSRMAKAK